MRRLPSLRPKSRPAFGQVWRYGEDGTPVMLVSRYGEDGWYAVTLADTGEIDFGLSIPWWGLYDDESLRFEPWERLDE